MEAPIDYTRVAYYYYKAKLTQEEIARKMNMSRQRVNRILGKCEELGIVKISIPEAGKLFLAMETELENRYGLQAVRLVASESPEDLYGNLGSVGADYLQSTAGDGDVIGFSRGRATAALVDQIAPLWKENLIVTQLVGGWNTGSPGTEADDIVGQFARKTGGTANKLFAPVLVNSPAIRKSIMEEPYFRKTYEVIRSCSIAVAGIGTIENRTLPADALSMTEERDLSAHLEGNAVGEICTHFFDIHGKAVRTELDDRMIAVSLEDFFKIPLRIGIAGGQEKTAAVTGAVRGGFVNVLITDRDTAAALLDE